MGDTDDLDNWETVVLEPLDTASGVVPAWLEAALSTEAAGPWLHYTWRILHASSNPARWR